MDNNFIIHFPKGSFLYIQYEDKTFIDRVFNELKEEGFDGNITINFIMIV
jgi:hypothetical protein